MNDTRRAVLEHLRARGSATISDLAQALKISPISIRHHLSGLQAEGAARVELLRQQVGRPRHVYSLTERAQQYFPQQYHVLVSRLLDEMKASLPAEQIDAIITRMAANVAARYGGQSTAGTLETRLQRLVEALGAEGFMAEVKQVGDNLVLTATACPYTVIGQRHPEVCQIDQQLIRTMLGADVEQTSCVLHGDRMCTFSVQS
jgi:predicted ArsR family transcriptional regulator